jgi:hypothetical protein
MWRVLPDGLRFRGSGKDRPCLSTGRRDPLRTLQARRRPQTLALRGELRGRRERDRKLPDAFRLGGLRPPGAARCVRHHGRHPGGRLPLQGGARGFRSRRAQESARRLVRRRGRCARRAVQEPARARVPADRRRRTGRPRLRALACNIQLEGGPQLRSGGPVDTRRSGA